MTDEAYGWKAEVDNIDISKSSMEFQYKKGSTPQIGVVYLSAEKIPNYGRQTCIDTETPLDNGSNEDYCDCGKACVMDFDTRKLKCIPRSSGAAKERDCLPTINPGYEKGYTKTPVSNNKFEMSQTQVVKAELTS